jgi:hypothetical protein
MLMVCCCTSLIDLTHQEVLYIVLFIIYAGLDPLDNSTDRSFILFGSYYPGANFLTFCCVD